MPSQMRDPSGELPGPPRPGARDQHAAQKRAREAMRELERRHRTLVWPLTAVFLGTYVVLILLASFATGLMQVRVVGPITVAYVLALLQFPLVMVMALLYTRLARRRLDPASDQVRAELFRPAPRKRGWPL